MRILLTGASGNFGRAFLAQAKHDIVQLNRGDWDKLDVKLSSPVDVIIHAASDLHSRVADTPANLLDSNVMATARLLEAAKKFCIGRFIFLSSCAVYGEDMRTSELGKCSPISINGIGKLLNEKIVAEFCSAHAIKFEIFRVFNTYGGLDRFSILSQIQRALEKGVPFMLNNRGIAQRDFIHVSDVARIVLLLLEKHIPYTHLNIGTGEATKISTVIDLVTKRFPKLLVQHKQVLEAEYSRADISRLLELVDIEFVRIEDYLMSDFMTAAEPA